MDISASKKDKQLGFGIAAKANPLHDIIFVDSVNGNNGNDGHDRRRAKLTIAAAVAVAEAGDTIICEGSFSEAVVVAVAGLRIIGAGPTPNRCIWTAAADAVCLTINGVADCRVENIRFRPPAYSAGTPAAISLASGANYTQIVNCRFQGQTGSYFGIKSTGADNVQIVDCEFKYLNNVTTVNGTAIATTAGDASGWVIKGNRFDSNIIDLDAQLRHSFVIDNYFTGGGLAAAGTSSATLTTKCVDISGAATGFNTVTGNYFGALYHADGGLFGGGTSDQWSGNHCKDRSHTVQVDATTGISIVVPA
jgi:hypothetical protein